MGISGIILAGGKSLRMGQDKTFMSFNNETLIEHTVKELQSVTDEIIIASNDLSKYNISGLVEVRDIFPDMGPLGGMHAGLTAAKNDYAFVVSSDLPMFHARLASYLLERRKGYDVVVPEIHGYWEPLCAVYARDCLAAIEKCLRADIRQVSQFYQDVKVLKIKEAELRIFGKTEELFYNLNTPEDYQALVRRKKDGWGVKSTILDEPKRI
ncbi:molybdenum cofactor guanylyltransferase [Candidatus Formimonas warabiya]|nr:molybdenum cofactor guanylyltransferase [Candidatus Formimonas warabiya]